MKPDYIEGQILAHDLKSLTEKNLLLLTHTLGECEDKNGILYF